jgi:O-antigen/teichoic acid export membrane protein
LADADLEKGLAASLLRNLSVQSGTMAVGIVLGFATTWALARALSVEAFGAFGFLFAFIYFFLALNDLGINTIMIREIAQHPERTETIVQNMLGFKLLVSFISLGIAWTAAGFVESNPYYRQSLRVYALMLPVQAMTLPMVVLQARMQIARGSACELIKSGTGFALMMTAVWMGSGLLGVAAALVGGEVAGLAATLAMTWSTVKPWPRVNTREWRRVLGLSLPLSGSSMLVVLLNKADIFMVKKFAGFEPLGYYNAAYKIPNLFERVPQMAMATIFPVMSRLASTDLPALARVYRRTLRNGVLLAVPMLIGVTVLAPFIIERWMTAAYLPAVPLLRILIWATAFLFVGITAGSLLIVLNRTRANFYAMSAATGVNLILNVLWIPGYGATGAAWANLAGFAVLCGSVLVLAERALADAMRKPA